ncbi:MAG: rod shape-determining protein RodA [Bacteroidota bacterium]
MIGYLKEYLDIRMLATVLGLLGCGLVCVYSATYDAGASDILRRQLLYAAAGTGVMLAALLLPPRFLTFISYPAYFASILLLVSVLLLGKTVSGSTSWFNLGAFRVQPSEFTKITTVMALAAFLSGRGTELGSFRNLAIASGIVLLPVALIMKQPDTGTAIIYLAMFIPLLYWGGAGRFTLLAIAAPCVAALTALVGITPFLIAVTVLGILIYLMKEHRIAAAAVFSFSVLIGISVQTVYNGLKPYQQKRIDTFLNPGADPLGAGYNVLQSKVAIGSGGLFGKGYLKGTQTQLNFIPEQWTDFIFCVPGEEFGFVGATLVLALFFLFLTRGVWLGSAVKTRYGSVLAIGLTSVIGAHVFINIGMAVGLLPVIGVPLPFMSYGGSALLTNMAAVGLLLNLYAHRKEH